MRYLSLLVLLMFGGCATYFEPMGGATAKLRVVSLPGSPTEVRELEEKHCAGKPGGLIAELGLRVKNGTNQGRNLHMALQDTVLRPTASELNVRAGEPFAAQFKAVATPGPKGSGWDYPACIKSFVLTPKEGEQYEAQLEQLQGSCQVVVFRLSRERDGSMVRRVAENGRELRSRCN